MVSILGDYSYTFPKPTLLKLKLKDLLEDNVDEKYYLSDDLMKHIQKTAKDHEEYTQYERYNGDLEIGNDTKIETCLLKNKGKEISKFTDNANTLMARDYKGFGNQEMNAVIEKGINNKNLIETISNNELTDGCYIDAYNKTINTDKSGTITTGVSFRNNTFLAIKNATKKGYLEATDGDGIDISSRMEHHRGMVQKGKTQTLTTMGGENNGVVVKPKVLGGIGEKDSNNNTQWKQQNRVYDNNVAISVTTAFNPYYACAMRGREGKQRIELSNRELANTITTVQKDSMVSNDLRIRKLTPRECFRLMGVKDEDFDKVRKNQSDASLYHLAGDSIVVNVLMAIFGELL